MALRNLNTGLKRGELQLSPKLIKILDPIIEEQIREKNDLNAVIDEEGQYPTEVNMLMIKINDEKYLPYFAKSGFGPIVKAAILQHGEKAYDLAIKLSQEFSSMNSTRKSGYIVFMADLIDMNRKGFVAKGEKRNNIKKVMFQIYSDIQYPDPKDKDYNRKIANLSREVISPFLTFFQVLGDTDVIPLVEKIAKENEFKDSYRKKYEKYRQMSGEELMKHWKEVEKMTAEDDEKIKAKGANALKDEEWVVKYPVREKAAKVLAELKKKHGIK